MYNVIQSYSIQHWTSKGSDYRRDITWSHTTYIASVQHGGTSPFNDRKDAVSFGVNSSLWGRICKWPTNELKVFSLWELINQGAPLLHIYIFLKSSQGSPVTNYSAFPSQLHRTSAPLSSCEHHTCIFAPFIFSSMLQAEGFLQRGEDKRGQGKSERGWRQEQQNKAIMWNMQKGFYSISRNTLSKYKPPRRPIVQSSIICNCTTENIMYVCIAKNSDFIILTWYWTQ